MEKIYAILFAVGLERVIEEGLRSLHVSYDGKQVEALTWYVLELQKWNDRINLTGLKDPEVMVRELLYDAFFLNPYVKGTTRILDVGSGAGILSIPLALLMEGVEVFSVDKSLRKIQFQRHIKRHLHLERFTPVHGRIEAVPPLEVGCLVVKGFASIGNILDLGGGHLCGGGVALIVKGYKELAVERDGFFLKEEIPYRLPDSEKEYRLLIYEKKQARAALSPPSTKGV